ncbi:MAG: hypothetical protein B6I23_03080 [Rickettsiaceae bacterium 4572_127]|nr:MAG: hypothetical protein B6I23_03080 [Rickettsiaceae bacterium 4572_127]
MQNSIKFERDRKKAAREKQAKEASHYSSGGSGSGNLSKKKEKIKRSRAKLSEVVENLFELENTGDKASSRSIRITDNSLKCR